MNCTALAIERYTWRAERRMGELLAAAKAAGQIKRGNPTGRNSSKQEEKPNPSKKEEFPRVVLEDVGIDHKLSSRAQQFAAVPEAQFEAEISDWRERASTITRRYRRSTSGTRTKNPAGDGR